MSMALTSSPIYVAENADANIVIDIMTDHMNALMQRMVGKKPLTPEVYAITHAEYMRVKELRSVLVQLVDGRTTVDAAHVERA